MKLTVVTVSSVIIRDIISANDEINEKWPESLELKIYFAGRIIDKCKYKEMETNLQSADIIILDLMGADTEIQSFIAEVCSNVSGDLIAIGGENNHIQELTRLGSFSISDMSGMPMMKGGTVDLSFMHKMKDMIDEIGDRFLKGKMRDIRNYIYIRRYWRCSSDSDMQNLLYFLLREYGKVERIPQPEKPSDTTEETGICSPVNRKHYCSIDEYAADNGFDEKRPSVVVLYYGYDYPNRTSKCVRQFIDKINDFANVIPIMFTTVSGDGVGKLKAIIEDSGKYKIDAIINFMSFRLGAGPMGGDADAAIEALKEFGVPLFHPFFMSKREIEEWKDSPQGISPSEFLISVMLPELDGCIETIPIGAMVNSGNNPKYDVKLSELSLIDERANKIASRVKNWLTLRTKQNKDKRVAIICYNYPPGEDNLFGGAFLDTFKSIEKLLLTLHEDGYSVDELTAEQLMEEFTAGKLTNWGKWVEVQTSNMIKYDKNSYESYLSSKSWEKDMVDQWGESPGNIMSEGDNFFIPGLVNGNIFIGLQPSRGIHEDIEKVYHDKRLLPHHQYIAFYKWIKEVFKADVIIHVGTHGTLEFLKGKECGMSGDCFPDMLISDIPHAYLYYSGNPAEAMIAKRRSHAVMVSYQPPAFVEGGLYGELMQLESMVNDFHEAQRSNPKSCDDIERNIRKTAEKLHIDMEDILHLERELYRIKRSLIPYGLHVFGKPYNKDEALSYMKFVLRYDHAGVKSLRRLVAEAQGLDYDMLLGENDTAILPDFDKPVSEMVEKYINDGDLTEEYCTDDKLKENFIKTLEYGKNAYEKVMNCHETDGLLKVLSGKYLPAHLAGDMIRSPEVLPSGYNMYQFDPRMVPTETAMDRGKEISQNTIENYRKQDGEYPKSIAIILWGLETSRTQGETVGQILNYLGVKVVSRKNVFQPQYEIIPYEELKRPRINVVVNMCGFFRDMFPNIIDDLNMIFKMVSNLDEPEEVNYLKASTERIYKKLLKDGYSQEEAEDLATARLFGPAEAEYGTGITSLIETKNWSSEEQIGEKYTESLKYVYSSNARGKAVPGLLNSHLQAVDIVSQIRSSHEYEVTDLDHYYEFFGGLSKSVEMAKGKKAVVYITDTTGENIETETVDKSIARGVRTRLLNPKWIDGMLKHKYHGASKISKEFENILGLAATTNKVDNWVFESMNSTYVTDDKMKKRMKENNQWAYLSIIETLLECNQRGYWQAGENEIDELRKVYLEVEGDIEAES